MFKKMAKGLSVSLLIIYASAAEAKRVALVVGNAAYKNEGVLSNPVNDASLIAKTLQNDLGFDGVKIIENADMRSLNRAVDEFGRKANGADAAFVYFSGHDLQTTDKQNYLLAVDAQIKQESDIKVSAITSLQPTNASNGVAIQNKPRDDLPLSNPEFKKWYDLTIKGAATAQINLGNMYYSGEGVTKDNVKAMEWYRKAAAQGNTTAQNSLGSMYYSGEGVTKDNVKAVEWWSKAAAQGNTTAQNNLGGMYYSGEGVTKDNVKAMEWYRKAAKQGNANGQNSLGYMYKLGEGASQDIAKSIEWFCKAAAQNIKQAKDELITLHAACR